MESILDSVIIGGNTEIIEKLVNTYKIDLNMLLEKACAGNKFEIFKY